MPDHLTCIRYNPTSAGLYVHSMVLLVCDIRFIVAWNPPGGKKIQYKHLLLINKIIRLLMTLKVIASRTIFIFQQNIRLNNQNSTQQHLNARSEIAVKNHKL